MARVDITSGLGAWTSVWVTHGYGVTHVSDVGKYEFLYGPYGEKSSNGHNLVPRAQNEEIYNVGKLLTSRR